MASNLQLVTEPTRVVEFAIDMFPVEPVDCAIAAREKTHETARSG
jgi:hypothetical protein